MRPRTATRTLDGPASRFGLRFLPAALGGVLSLAAPGCIDDDKNVGMIPTGGETGPATVSFQDDVAPIFAQKCVGCHHPGNPIKVDLTQPFDPEVGIVGRKNSWPDSTRPTLVVPGEPDQSSIMLKFELTEYNSQEGNPMPLILPRLTDEEIESLRTWIDAGANDDAQFQDEIKLILGDGETLGSKAGKCAWCHYADFPWGNFVDPFDPVNGAVGISAVTGGTRVIPGDAANSLLFRKVSEDPLATNLGGPMPLQPAAVTEDEKATIRTWIAEGARDN